MTRSNWLKIVKVCLEKHYRFCLQPNPSDVLLDVIAELLANGEIRQVEDFNGWITFESVLKYEQIYLSH